MKFMKYTIIMVFFIESIAFSNDIDSQIDFIIGALSSHRDRLVNYKTDYKIVTLSKPISSIEKQDMFFSSSNDASERISTGSYIMDRESNRFKYETNDYCTWNATDKKFTPMPFKVSNDGKKHTLFQSQKDNYFAQIKDEKCMTQVGCNPRDFFTLGVKLLDLVDMDRNNISDIIELDGGMYKVMIKESLENENELLHEFILDPSFDWNVISLKSYTDKGQLAEKQEVEYELIDGISFIKNANLYRYNVDNPKELYWSEALTVDVDSVKMNLAIEDEDFQINLPHGTRVYDARHELSFTIGGKKSILNAEITDPAVLFASGNESKEFSENKEELFINESENKDYNIDVNVVDITPQTTLSQITPESKSTFRVLLPVSGGMVLLISILFAFRRIKG